MADQDPPVGPLHRLDPSEPDEAQELGRLEPLDPEMVETTAEAPGHARLAGSPRPRDGLALAVALAVLLSLSSIAAIGGLVAISVRSLEPAPEAAITAPIESAASGRTIRVIESAAGPESSRGAGSQRDTRPAGEQSTEEAVAPPPAPAVAPPPAPSGGGKSDEEPEGGRGGGRRWGVGGAWCDAAPGAACDVIVGGPLAQPVDGDADQASRESDVEGSGFLPTEEEGDFLDDGKHGKRD
ncbi:MAG: hypothetical protein ACRDHM_03120 [Actinomycetota bacterium]